MRTYIFLVGKVNFVHLLEWEKERSKRTVEDVDVEMQAGNGENFTITRIPTLTRIFLHIRIPAFV